MKLGLCDTWGPCHNGSLTDPNTSQTSYYMGVIAGTAQRFFHPATIDQMLETFVPLINGTDLNVCLNYTAERLRNQLC